jgi:nucleoside-diphosphate-sugar epimerase
LVGGAVLDTLLEHYNGRIHLLVRSPEKLPRLPEGVQVFQADLEEQDQFPPQGFIPEEEHVLIHCASRVTDPDNCGYEMPNIVATSRLAGQLHSKTRAIVYHSSMSVYGSGRQVMLNEDLPCRPWTELAKSRYEAEMILLSRARSLGCHGIAFRPRFIVSERERFFVPQLMQFSRLGTVLGDGCQEFSLIDAADYGRIIWMTLNTLADRTDLVIQPLNVGCKQPISLKQIVSLPREGRLSAARSPAPAQGSRCCMARQPGGKDRSNRQGSYHGCDQTGRPAWSGVCFHGSP